MSRIRYLLIAFFLAGLTLVFGQTEEEELPKLLPKETRNRLGVGLGFHHNQTQDLLFSPMIYNGRSLLAIELSYQRRTKKNLHSVRVAFDRISVKSTKALTFPFFERSITRQTSAATFVDLKYGYAREIMHTEKFNLLFGGMLDNQIHAVEYQFAEYDEVGYLLSYSLAVWLKSEYHIDQKQSVNFEMSFPLVYFLSRPPYAVVDNEGIQAESAFIYAHERGEWHALNGFVKWNLLLNYNWQVSPKFDLLLSYQFTYYSASEPLKLSVVKNSVDIGFALKF